MYVLMDGVQIPAVAAATEGRAGRTEGQRARTRECKARRRIHPNHRRQGGVAHPRPGFHHVCGGHRNRRRVWSPHLYRGMAQRLGVGRQQSRYRRRSHLDLESGRSASSGCRADRRSTSGGICAKSPPNKPALNPVWRSRSGRKPITLKPTWSECAIRSFVKKDSSLAPAYSKPGVNPSPDYASSNPECTGPSEVPMPSLLCAAADSIKGLRTSGPDPPPSLLCRTPHCHRRSIKLRQRYAYPRRHAGDPALTAERSPIPARSQRIPSLPQQIADSARTIGIAETIHPTTQSRAEM